MRTTYFLVGCFMAAGAAPATASQAASAPPTAASTPAVPTGEKLICRKQIETGSLVRGKKTCMTRAEWAKVGDAARDGGQYLLEQNEGKPACQGGGC